MVSARKCSGCGGQKGPITPIMGAYWHLPCYRNAKPESRRRAAKLERRKQDEAWARRFKGDTK